MARLIHNSNYYRHLFLDESRFSAYFSKKLIDKRITANLPHWILSIDPIVPFNENFKIGDLYSLSGNDCDGFKMDKKVYQLIAIVNEFNGNVLDSLVMKQVDGDSDTIFSLTKNDCKLLGVEFQSGLQLFPKKLNWVHEKIETNETTCIEEKHKSVYPFEYDMSKYPVNAIDKTIRNITISIDGCHYIDKADAIYIMQYGVIFAFNLKNRLFIINKSRNNLFNPYEHFNYRVITSKVSECDTNDYVDVNGKMFLEIECIKEKCGKEVGLDPILFANKKISDIIDIEMNTIDLNFQI